jgi:predicted  nucleic acid-binding Zn-ribbon protein
MERSVAQVLDSLAKLQSIDSELDELIKIRGALPEEVGDLEDEITGYETRIEKFNSEIERQNEEISTNKMGIQNANKLILKYGEQQNNVRNNREYDALTKEVELQQLEIQICEKKIREAQVIIDQKNEEISGTKSLMEERQKDLIGKKKELANIVSESEEEEKKLNTDREKASKPIEERLLKSYNKIRQNARNGLAVVSVKRDACGGCFNIVPPQRQAEVKERKKLIVCEHCGRIFADVEDIVVDEVKKKTKRTVKKK